MTGDAGPEYPARLVELLGCRVLAVVGLYAADRWLVVICKQPRRRAAQCMRLVGNSGTVINVIKLYPTKERITVVE